MDTLELTMKIRKKDVEIINSQEKSLKIPTTDEIGKKFSRQIKGELGDTTIKELSSEEGISRMSYYRDKKRYLSEGLTGLKQKKRGPKKPSKVDEDVEQQIVWYRVNHPELNYEQITNEINKKQDKMGKKITPRATSKVLEKHYLSKKNLRKKSILSRK